MSNAENGGRLSRWSRRKAEERSVKRGRAAPVALDEKASAPVLGLATPDDVEAAMPVPEDATVRAEAPDDGDDLTEAEREALIADLPDIESLNKDSDYTPFMQKGVPQDLMKAALRRLWLSDPIFANLDGMNEYDENYRLIDRAITLADTNYQVGKGFITEEDEAKEAAALAEAEDAANEQGGEVADTDSVAVDQEAASNDADESDETSRETTTAEVDDDDHELDDDPELG